MVGLVMFERQLPAAIESGMKSFERSGTCKLCTQYTSTSVTTNEYGIVGLQVTGYSELLNE